MSPALLLSLTLLASIAPSTPGSAPRSPRLEVVSCAAGLVGQQHLTDVLPNVADDAAGLVNAAYAGAGVKLVVGKARSEGVAALWRKVLEKGALKHRFPRAGDLVFFRDTQARDGRFDGGLSHVGVVERVAEDGTVTFIHRGPRGVARAHLNTEEPTRRFDWKGGRILNDKLREATGEVPAALAGELFAGYGAASVLVGELDRNGAPVARHAGLVVPAAQDAEAAAPAAEVQPAKAQDARAKATPALAREVERLAEEGVARNRAVARGSAGGRVLRSKAVRPGKVAATKRARHHGRR